MYKYIIDIYKTSEQIAYDLYDQNKHEESLPFFLDAIQISLKIENRNEEQNNTLALLYITYGRALIKLKYYTEALKCIENACNIRPKIAYQYEILGEILIKIGKIDESKKYFMRSIEIDPNEPYPIISLFFIFVVLREYDNAKKLLITYPAHKFYPRNSYLNRIKEINDSNDLLFIEKNLGHIYNL